MTETWTFDRIKSFSPCYSNQELRKLRNRAFPDRKSVTPLEVCDCEVIPVEDRIWLLCRSAAAPAAIERIVTRVVKVHCLTCGIAEVEEWAKKWLDGSDRSRESAKAAKAAATKVRSRFVRKYSLATLVENASIWAPEAAAAANAAVKAVRAANAARAAAKAASSAAGASLVSASEAGVATRRVLALLLDAADAASAAWEGSAIFVDGYWTPRELVLQLADFREVLVG